MVLSFYPSAHSRKCAWKHGERQRKIDALPPAYSASLSLFDKKILALPISQLVPNCKSGKIAPSEIMMAYGKMAVLAQKETNCLTEVMFEEALCTPSFANWGPGGDSDTVGSEGTCERLLMGVPISIKDTVNILGCDTTIGLSNNVGCPAASSSSIVRLLRDAGALLHAKSTVPTGLLSLETTSDIFGQTNNPYSKQHTCGASTGGGAALVAAGGSKIEIGTDIGGSIRIPAHFCGIWSLKGSAGRFPSWGCISSLQGLEGVQIVTSPMAGSLDDLYEFWKRVVALEPWGYDHTCIPLPWRPVNLREEGRRMKWGVLWDDGMVPPSPACKRALDLVIGALKRQGHEVTAINPPNISEGLKVGYQLLFSEGGQQLRNALAPSESASASATAILGLFSLPRWFKKLLSFFNRSRDPLFADMIQLLHPKTVLEERDLVVRREEYRAAWHDQWIEEGLDFVLSVPHSLPALPHGGALKATLMSTGFTFIPSLLDYTAGVLPVTFVDKNVDALPDDFFSSSRFKSMNSVAKGAYSVYNANEMHGLPLGVQVIGRRLEEEKVLEGMKVIEEALRESGNTFIGKLPNL